MANLHTGKINKMVGKSFAETMQTLTLKVMEECVDNGLVRSIGLANFNIDQLNRVSDMASIQPSVHQVVYQELSLH